MQLRSDESGSRENLYTLACNAEQKKIKYCQKNPSKITQTDIEIIDRFYEQLNRQHPLYNIKYCCNDTMKPCFNSDEKGYYCGRCFKWLT